MTILALRGIQLPLQIGHRAGLDRRRPPPSDGGDKLSPGIKQIGVDAQLPPNNLSRLTAAKPVQDRLTFEGFVEFPVLSDSCLFHGSSRSLSTQFSVRQFEATSVPLSLNHGCTKENSSANYGNDREWTCLGSNSRKFVKFADIF